MGNQSCSLTQDGNDGTTIATQEVVGGVVNNGVTLKVVGGGGTQKMIGGVVNNGVTLKVAEGGGNNDVSLKVVRKVGVVGASDNNCSHVSSHTH